MSGESQLRGLLNRYKPRVRDEGGQPEGVAEHPDDLIAIDASLHILCKDIGDHLWKNYPGFAWAISPDKDGGIINIYCLNFSNQYGFTIRTAEIQDDPRRALADRAGRELLRRFRYPGIRFDAQLVNSVPRLPNGEAIPDVSDMPPSKMKAQAEAQLAIVEGRATFVTIDGETFLHVTEKK